MLNQCNNERAYSHSCEDENLLLLIKPIKPPQNKQSLKLDQIIFTCCVSPENMS